MEFWEKLEDEIVLVSEVEGLIILGYVNANTGRDREGFEEEMACYGFGDRNGGDIALELCKNDSLRVLNTYFKKD
jgi:hypothetical protein